MYKLICSLLAALVVFIARFQPGVEPLVVQWLAHYVRGTQTEMTLPPHAVAACEKLIVDALASRFGSPGRPVRTPAKDSLSLTAHNDGGWWTSLSGVVGTFNFRILLTEYGVVYQAYDTWDFNLGKSYLSLTLPFSWPKPVMIGKRDIQINGKRLTIKERWLSRFNERHAFHTRWDGMIDWGNFPPEVKAAWLAGDKTNPSYPHTSQCGNYAWLTRSKCWGYPGGEAAWKVVFESESSWAVEDDDYEPESSWAVEYSDDE